MSTYKILHLYSDALDLYGDYKNLSAVAMRVKEMGHDCVIDHLEYGDRINTNGYNLVYIGHGKPRNLRAVSEHFVNYKNHIIEQIEKGQLFFVTGSARLLFGTGFETVDGEQKPGIGLFNYYGIEIDSVFVSDMLLHPTYDPNTTLYGFTNRNAHIYFEGVNPSPLFNVSYGPTDNAALTGVEGTLYKNFFGTWSMGPLLARNPAMMREILRRMMGEEYRECDYSLEQKAIEITLATFD